MDTRRLLLTLKQQFWLLLGLSLLILTAFVLIPELGKKVSYVSKAKILLTPPQRSTGFLDNRTGALDTNNWITDKQTLNELVTSERLLSRVCAVCNLRIPWQELRENILFEPLAQDPFQRNISLFALSVTDSSPTLAKKINEAAVQEFLTYVEELSAREFANTRRFLEELVAEAKEKVDDCEEKLLSITSSHSDTAEGKSASDQLDHLEDEKRRAKDELAQLKADVGAVESYLSGAYSSLPSVMSVKGDNGLGQLQAATDAARLKLVELEQLYTPTNIQVVEQKSKLLKLEEVYNTRSQASATTILKEKSALIAEKVALINSCDARISELRGRLLSPAEKRQVAKLERQLAMWEENHLALVKQLYQARVVEQSSRRQGAITILENPSLGAESKEKRTRSFGARLALGLPFSVCFAVGIIFSIQFVWASLRLVPKIESSLGIPVMAVIPPVDPELGELWERYKREDTLPQNRLVLLDESVEPLEASVRL